MGNCLLFCIFASGGDLLFLERLGTNLLSLLSEPCRQPQFSLPLSHTFIANWKSLSEPSLSLPSREKAKREGKIV